MKTISILSASITNFRSIRNVGVINFPQSPGLRFLGGSNQQEANLGSNGSGKSSLWEAIFWCLYGSSNNGRISSLTSWGATETQVHLLIRVNNRNHTVIRIGPPVKLFVNGKPTEQFELDRILGLTKLAFPHAVIFSQDQRFFPDLSIPERGDLLEEVLRISFWSRCSEVTSSELSTIEKILGTTRQQSSLLEGKILGLETIKNLETKQSNWELQRQIRIEQLNGKVEDWEKNKQASLESLRLKQQGFADTLRKELVNLDEQEKEWLATQEKLVIEKIDQLQQLEEEIVKLNDTTGRKFVLETDGKKTETDLDRIRYSLAKSTNTHEKTSSQIDFWKKTTTCSACLQQITENHRNVQLAVLEKERIQAVEEVREATSSHISQVEKLRNLKVELLKETERENSRRVLVNEAERWEKEIEKLVTQKGTSPYHELKISTASRTNSFDQVIKREEETSNPFSYFIIGEKATDNPWTLEILKNFTDRQQFLNDLQKKQKEVEQLTSKALLTEYWKQGFKRLRIFLMNRVMRALEIEVNSAASTLGLLGWELKLSSETETKSGTIKLGVQIQVKSPVSVFVPWESWSGGEAQRLKLALALGLSSLLQRASGTNWNLEVYDERTTYLSTEGVENLLATLDYRAEATGKPLWVVDHSALTYSGFKEVWTATKTEEGTKFSVVV